MAAVDLQADDVSRVLVITAHPDDVDFGAAGTIASLVASGIQVTYCVITDGDAGGFEPSTPRGEIPAIRRREQIAAAAIVGVHDVRFLGYSDGELSITPELRRDLTRVIRQVRPQRVITTSPERNWERIGASHRDHLTAGEAALQAIYPDARNQFAHPALLAAEGLHEWVVSELWMFGGPSPNLFMDVTDQFPMKMAALRAHVSQTGHMPDLDQVVREWMSAAASRGGLGEGRLAEAFHSVRTG